MKILTRILFVVAALVVLFLLIGLFLPSHTRIERSTVINAPPDEVYSQIVDLKRWLEWNPWSEMEPTATNTISVPSSGIGATWSWKGEEVGVGSMTITAVKGNEAVDMDLKFEEPMEALSKNGLRLTPEGDGTRVTWWFEEDLDWPMGRYFGLMMDGMLGADFEKGLANLKKCVESGC